MAELNLQKLVTLRKVMADNGVDAYIIPTADAHISEYVSEHDKRRAFISEFTGSAGTAVVTADAALLYTDARYFLQAGLQLPSHWTLMKEGVPATLSPQAYLAQNLKANAVVAVDPFLFQVSKYQEYAKFFKQNNLQFKSFLNNFIDEVWAADQPALSTGVINPHPLKYAGETTESKIAKLRSKMAENKAQALVLCALCEIAYVFNLRGSDIDFNPVFLAYSVITETEVFLFVNDKKFSKDVQLPNGFIVRPYDDIIPYLQSLKSVMIENKAKGVAHKAWVDSSKSNFALFNAFDCKTLDESEDFIISSANPTTLMKAIKNEQELEGMRQAHIRDGVALSRFLAFFESQFKTLPVELKEGEVSTWNEYTLSEKLESFRAQQDKFVQLSFDSISSVGANGAIIHYKPDENTSAEVTQGNVYLLDSGAQYLDGTTDVTRTFYIPSPSKPTPTDFQMDTNTRVLQGHIAIALAKFPTNTVGPALDALARQYLWQICTSFLHGTGHGVGAFLNVHEGPIGIAMPIRQGPQLTTPLVDGMVLSNEPGYYHDGEFGIRIENLVYTTKVQELQDFNTKYGDWYQFENLTFVPIDRALIKKEMLSQEQINYVNKYHAQCLELLMPLMQAQNDQIAIDWLKRNTQPL